MCKKPDDPEPDEIRNHINLGVLKMPSNVLTESRRSFFIYPVAYFLTPFQCLTLFWHRFEGLKSVMGGNKWVNQWFHEQLISFWWCLYLMLGAPRRQMFLIVILQLHPGSTVKCWFLAISFLPEPRVGLLQTSALRHPLLQLLILGVILSSLMYLYTSMLIASQFLDPISTLQCTCPTSSLYI